MPKVIRQTPAPAATTLDRPALPPWQSWWIALILLVTVIAYLPVFRAGFVWDDGPLAIDNPHVVQPDGIFKAFTSFDGPDYWPLTAASFWLEYRLWGNNATGFHVVQVLLHAANAAVVLLILRKLKVPAALLIALLFAVHPMAVESVAWVAEQKNTLSFLLAALSVLAYLAADDAADGNAGSLSIAETKWRAAALALFVLSLLSKASTVVLPVIVLLLTWWRGRLSRRSVFAALPFFAASAVMGLVTIRFQTAVLPPDIVHRSWDLRIAQAGCSIWFYPLKAWLPVDLATMCPEWQANPNSALPWLALFLAVVAALMMWWYRKKMPGAGTLAAIYAVIVLPTLGLINMAWTAFSPVADHFVYLALPALIALPVAGAMVLLRKMPPSTQRVLPLIGTAAVVTLAGLTILQSAIYTSSHTLWEFNVTRRPSSWFANAQFGRTIYSEGKVDDAVGYLTRSAQLRPVESRTWNWLGEAFQVQGDLRVAAAAYAEATKFYPTDRGAKSGLGYCLFKLGDESRGLGTLQEAVQQDAGDAEGFVRLGAALLAVNRTTEARAALARASQLNPSQEPRVRAILQAAPPPH